MAGGGEGSPVLASGHLVVSVDPAPYQPLCSYPGQCAVSVLSGPEWREGLWSSGEMVRCRNSAQMGPGPPAHKETGATQGFQGSGLEDTGNTTGRDAPKEKYHEPLRVTPLRREML